MTKIRFTAMPTEAAMHIWNGGADAYGLAPESFVSDGDGNPCRHCLEHIGCNEPALLFAYRAFPTLQAYAESGPIFLHAEPCARYAADDRLPPIFSSPDYIVRGYDDADRIVYGSGAVIATEAITERASEMLATREIAYVHVRSSRNNCYHCRIDRAS